MKMNSCYVAFFSVQSYGVGSNILAIIDNLDFKVVTRYLTALCTIIVTVTVSAKVVYYIMKHIQIQCNQNRLLQRFQPFFVLISENLEATRADEYNASAYAMLRRS